MVVVSQYHLMRLTIDLKNYRYIENYRKSYGSTISEERLKLYNPLTTIKIIDKFDDTHKPCGTLAILTFIQSY
jgi:hypothetical protein